MAGRFFPYSVIFWSGACIKKKNFPLKNLNFGGKPVKGYATSFENFTNTNTKDEKKNIFQFKFSEKIVKNV
jgi:hypothetical protein